MEKNDSAHIPLLTITSSWVPISNLIPRSNNQIMSALQRLGPRLLKHSTLTISLRSKTMLNQRACRVLQDNASSSQSTQPTRGSGARLSTAERIHGWMSMTYKYLVIMNHMLNNLRVKAILGKDLFDKAFPPVVKTITIPEDKKKEVTRIIKGEIVEAMKGMMKTKRAALTEPERCVNIQRTE